MGAIIDWEASQQGGGGGGGTAQNTDNITLVSPYAPSPGVVTAGDILTALISKLDGNVQTKVTAAQVTTAINNVLASINGDATITGTTLNISNSAITNAKMATMASNTIKGNITGSLVTPSDIPLTSLWSALSPSIANGDSLMGIDVVNGGTTNTVAMNTCLLNVYNLVKQIGLNSFSTTLFVDPVSGTDTGTGGVNYPVKTIAQANALAASLISASPSTFVTIYLMAGTYTERIVLISQVSISCLGSPQLNSVIVNGSFNASGLVSSKLFELTGLTVFTTSQSFSNACVSVTGTTAVNLQINNCWMNNLLTGRSGQALNMTNSNPSTKVITNFGEWYTVASGDNVTYPTYVINISNSNARGQIQNFYTSIVHANPDLVAINFFNLGAFSYQQNYDQIVGQVSLGFAGSFTLTNCTITTSTLPCIFHQSSSTTTSLAANCIWNITNGTAGTKAVVGTGAFAYANCVSMSPTAGNDFDPALNGGLGALTVRGQSFGLLTQANTAAYELGAFNWDGTNLNFCNSIGTPVAPGVSTTGNRVPLFPTNSTSQIVTWNGGGSITTSNVRTQVYVKDVAVQLTMTIPTSSLATAAIFTGLPAVVAPTGGSILICGNDASMQYYVQAIPNTSNFSLAPIAAPATALTGVALSGKSMTLTMRYLSI